MRTLHADWQTIRLGNRIVWIVDLNRGHKSVTNDAAHVARQVNQQYPFKRIIYRDSLGMWSELLHENGDFRGFAPVDPSECI